MITVCSVTGVNITEHHEAIERTQRAIPRLTRKKLHIVPGMTLADYSNFIVLNLHEIIDTEYVLLCQADGYGRNIELWSDDFLDFDYVGAPFPTGETGNGGLSLRSKAFLDACRTMGEPTIAEDAYLCQSRRSELESMGIKFAPQDVAFRFSFEHPVPGIDWDASKSWGVHGTWNL